MKRLKIKIMLALAILGSSFLFSISAFAAINCAAPNLTAKQQIQCGTCDAAGTTASCTPAAAPKTLSDTIATVINILSVIVGAVAVIMIIIGGFRYIVSAGNAEQAKGARNTLLYAVIGLVIIAMAQIIVQFVIQGVQNCPNGKTATGQCK
jgi:putative exporter of polyketide antibiotics